MRFQVFFEFQSSVFIGKSGIPNQNPRNEFGRVGGLASVMIGHSPLQVSGDADIVLFRGARTADYLNVPHNAAPARLRFRFAQATPDTLRPSGYAWLRHA
jgi:hypothetical protein